ncbi:MAG: B12-binding domain-containing radical SAM protein, partial [Intestinibacter sp.]
MKSLKILLTTLNSKFIHTNLAIRYIKESIKDLADVEIREYTINNQLDYILKDIYLAGYDAVFFSTYIWNVYDIVKLCENLKKVNPKLIIGLGGPEVSYDSEEAMAKYEFVDYILRGEGEMVMRDLVKYFNGEMDIKDVDGVTYRCGDEVIKNKERELLKDLDLIPSPYENLNPKEYENRIVYYETSRGCPFNCQYCLSSAIKGLRYFSIDRVKRDLKKLIDAKVSQIKFIDRTFNANKKFAKEIMKFLMENDNGYTTYHFEVTAHLLDDDMLEFLRDCKEGLFQFEIGVQTTNQEALDAVGRRDDFER